MASTSELIKKGNPITQSGKQANSENALQSAAKAAASAASVAAARTAQTAKTTGAVKTAPASGYYSRPEIGTQSSALFNAADQAERTLKQREDTMTTLRDTADSAYSELERWTNNTSLLLENYKRNPTAENEAYYRKAEAILQMNLDKFRGVKQPYQDAEKAYHEAFTQYETAVRNYNDYSKEQERLYTDWKGTIRGADAIRADLEALGGEIAAQKQREYQPVWQPGTLYQGGAAAVSESASLPYAAAAGNVQTRERSVSPQMQALLERQALLQEELDWSEYFRYADLMQNADFGEKSKYVSTENGKGYYDPFSGQYLDPGFGDIRYDYINRNERARSRQSTNEQASGVGNVGAGSEYLSEMSDDEIAIFNYVYATEGKDAAYSYLDYLTKDLTARQRQRMEEEFAQFAKAHPVGASALSILESPGKGISYLGQAADYLVDGEIDQNAGYNQFSYTGNAIRSQVSQTIEKSGKWGKVGSWLYQTGMSMGDFLLSGSAFKVSQALSLAIMGTGAAADAVIDAKDRGLRDDQAFALGTIAGLAEVITERASLEALLKPRWLKDGTKKYIIKNVIAEGSEEGASDLINLFADILISQDKSQWQQSIDYYKSLGMSEGEAFGNAYKDQALSVFADMAGGALSGGIVAGGHAAFYNRNTNHVASFLNDAKLDGESIQAMIDTGLESDSGTESYQIAKELKEKIGAGETPSEYDLARLFQANEAAIEEEQQEKRNNEENGVTEDKVGESFSDIVRKQILHNVAGENAIQENENNMAQIPEQEQQKFSDHESDILSLLTGGRYSSRNAEMTNGGNEYVNVQSEQQRAEGTGNRISDGNQQWNAGAHSGEQTGSMAGGTGEKRGVSYADGSRAAIERQNTARYLRLEKVSSRDLGLESGTTAKNIQVMPQENWDVEMTQLADRIYNETGKGVTYVIGRIQIRGVGGTVGYARGVISGDKIIVQADNLSVPMEKIADHEAYHAKADFAGNAKLNEEIKRHILDTFSEEQFQKVLEQYIVSLRGVYNVADAETGEEFESLVQQIEEEIFADAYAGINAFGANADQFTNSVNERMDQLGMGKLRNQQNGTEQPTGPPVERYSYAGKNANNADLEALKRAKQMKLEGVADETDSLLDQESDGLSLPNDENLTIYPEMDDAERAQILAKKEIRVPAYDSGNPVTGAQIIKLKGKYTSEANKLLRVLAENCGVFNREYYNADVDLQFEYSKRSLHESINKQAKRGSGAEEFGKMLTVLPQICESAVEIEAHTDKYAETKRMDSNLEEVHVLLSAFSDGDTLIPVQLEIKEYQQEKGRKDKLYLTVTLKKTEAGISLRAPTDAYAQPSIHSTPASTINVADLVANVKDDTGDLVKYLPNEMLNQEQRDAKADALAREAERLGDMQYEFAVEQGNTEKAEGMLRDRAGSKGYAAGDDWRMSHRAPNAGSGTALPDADAVYGGDGSIYSPAAATYYGEGRAYEGKAIATFTKARNNPEAKITVYRAVPADIQDTKLRNGDWVTPTREYASEHGEMYLDGEYRIVKESVPAKYLYVNGDSIHEFGYDNGREDEVYKNTRNNVKRSGVTYDDNGRLIPLSSRYDDRNSDVRYSLDNETEIHQNEDKSNSEDTFSKVQSEWEKQQEWMKDGWMRNQLGDEGYKKYQQWEQKKKQEQKDSQKAKRIVEQNKRKIRTEAHLNEEERLEKKRAAENAKPKEATRDLRNTLNNLFFIPEGQRAELNSRINSYADRLLRNGVLTEDDRKNFFNMMYEAGVMTVPADEYYAMGRGEISGGKIYINSSVRSEFGDDWGAFRRRAFAAGVYLTNNPEDSGVDVWNGDLADMLPGLFDSEETDARSILERIIQVAEEGKDEHVSLPEYTARLAKIDHTPESVYLDNMERQMDEALRTFAEKASLEVKLKERAEKDRSSLKKTNIRLQATLAAEREERVDMARQQQERKAIQELQQKTLKQLQWLSKNRNRAPEELRSTWDEVLSDIDIFAVGAANEMNWSDKYNATWKDLAQMYKDAQTNDPNFLPSKELERIVTRLDGTKIADMDLGALQDLYKAAVGLRTEFYNRNNIINDEQNRLFAEVYTDAKREIEAAPGKYTGNLADKFMNMDQLTPMNVLQRMGGWNPNGAFYSMAKQLERGERDMRAYTVKANRMLQDFLTEHEDWVKRADGQGKDAIWYKLEVPELLQLGMGDKPIFGETVTVYMTPAQKVHMYLESKNVDNLRHMTGGRTFVDKELYSKGKRQEALSQGKTVRLAPETVKKLVSDLTPEEMELARVLDQYYNSFATQEINKVSNVLYGYDKAMGKNYAPIYTNRNYTKTEFGVFDTTAEGVGNLKDRQYAVNPSYNISALDAFERHVDQTARFCGMAIPARNWTTLMNWREKNNSTGDVITHKWGDEGKKYISDLITKLQSGDDSSGDTISKSVDKLMSNYISAVFGANPSIVLKQLGSIPLASAYLGAKNFPSVFQIRSIDRKLISKYTQDLEWRTMGYSMPETKLLKDNPNWTQSNKVFGFIFGGDAITAMDGWAASVLWPWAEKKVRREYPDMEIGTKAQIENGESQFYKKVAEEFENAVARSQSTSDEIHQSILRKSKHPFTRAFTMFRSDSAQTYNALRQKIGEARYYVRTGADKKTIRTAQRAVGSAFLSAVLGYMWAEGVEFLMNLWKHKGKKYRDDDDELTAGSVIGEMVSGLVGDMAGIITGGEELYDFIGGMLTDGTWFGIETMGLEQLNDCLETVFDAGAKVRDIVADGKNVLDNGGDLGKYFRRHGNDMLGGIKDLAMTVATYFPGLPVNNLEAYLMGPIAWVAPGLKERYDDLFQTVQKNSLSEMKGEALAIRVGNILENRQVSESENTARALAELYEAGCKKAVPSDTPNRISVDGEERTLDAFQKQQYEQAWSRTVSGALEELIDMGAFQNADEEDKERFLINLYSYGAEQAKASVFEDYSQESWAEKNSELISLGVSLAECSVWNVVSREMKSGEKAAELAAWDLPEKEKRAVFRLKISETREDDIDAILKTGLSFDQFLTVYSKYGEINDMDAKAVQKATEFSRWLNGQNFTEEQKKTLKDSLSYFNMVKASADRYDGFTSEGLSDADSNNLVEALGSLQPEEGKTSVSDVQKWRVCVDFSEDESKQMKALSEVMRDSQYEKLEIAYSYDITPNAYVRLKEVLPKFDADENGSYKNEEVKEAIDAISGGENLMLILMGEKSDKVSLTTEQKAVLWQLATGSKSARNNPYSKSIGQEIVDKLFPSEDTESTSTISFQDEVLRQLMGNG